MEPNVNDPQVSRDPHAAEGVAGEAAGQPEASAAPRATDRAVFSVRGLEFSYPGDHKGCRKRIFGGLDLDLREGVVTTLIGANGSGKSTLFNLLTKNLVPDAGQILLRGGNVADMRLSDFARLVAIVHQNNVAPADLTVERLVRYGRVPFSGPLAPADRDEDERWVHWALATTHLLELADRPIGALSGGQRQRAWLAMSLAQGSDVLLLDEPTTFLDIRYQLQLLRLVRELNRQFGLTVIMVLHDVNQAMRYSDEIVALAHGRIVAQGVPDDVVTPALMCEVYGVGLEVANVGGRPFVLTV